MAHSRKSATGRPPALARIPIAATLRHPKDLVDAALEAQRTFGHVAHFRGLPNADWSLVPSLFRARSDGWIPPDFDVYERSITNDFLRFAPSRHAACPPLADRVAWLCVMRHHGVPTRLLDWSASIFVATFFAVCEEFDKPSDIWALNTARLNGTEVGTQGNLSMRGGNETVRNLVDRPFEDRPSTKKTVFVIAPEVAPRLLAQQSAFTVHGSPLPLEAHRHSSTFLLRYRIEPSMKKPMLHMLEVLGFTRMTLFPDLDNLAHTLRERRFR